jgi:hypothetical protein
MYVRFVLLAALLTGCSASTTAPSSGSPTSASADAGAGGALSCDGFVRAEPAVYSKVGSKLERFPAVIEGTLDTAADSMPYSLVLTEPAEVTVRITMSIAGAGAGVATLASKSESTGTTLVSVLGPGILPPGTHPLLVFPGKTGTGPFRVEVEAFGARARMCDAAFVDPSAGATDALASHECASFLTVSYCSLTTPVDDAANRARYCAVADAPCARAAREYLSCVTIEGACDANATTVEGYFRKAPSCAVRADVCP